MQTNNVNWATGAPLTIDTLKSMMEAMPPRETFLSSVVFPADHAARLTTKRENWTAAHPDFWARVMAAIGSENPGKRASLEIGLWADPRPLNLDVTEDDSDEARKAKAAEMERYAVALAGAIAGVD